MLDVGTDKGKASDGCQPVNAVSEAELRAYYDRKRPMASWSFGLALPGAALLAAKSPLAAVALVVGVSCGILNALLTMRGNERLANHQSVSTFVVSSILRIGVFGVLPVTFALHGPWWTMAAYFLGFFLPLALYALIAWRAVRTKYS